MTVFGWVLFIMNMFAMAAHISDGSLAGVILSVLIGGLIPVACAK